MGKCMSCGKPINFFTQYTWPGTNVYGCRACALRYDALAEAAAAGDANTTGKLYHQFRACMENNGWEKSIKRHVVQILRSHAPEVWDSIEATEKE